MEDAKREMQRKHRQAGPSWDEHHRPAEVTDGGIGVVIDQVDSEAKPAGQSKPIREIDRLIDRVEAATRAQAEAKEKKADAEKRKRTKAPTGEEWRHLAKKLSTIAGKTLTISEDPPAMIRELAGIAVKRNDKEAFPPERNQEIFVVVEIDIKNPTKESPEFRANWKAAAYVPGSPSAAKDGIWRTQSTQKHQTVIRAHVHTLDQSWGVRVRAERSAENLARRAIFNLVQNTTAHRYAEVKKANRLAKEGQAQPDVKEDQAQPNAKEDQAKLKSATPPIVMKAAPYPIPLVRIAELRRYIDAFGGGSDAALSARAEIQRYRSSMGRAELPAVVALDQRAQAVEKALNPENKRVFWAIIGKTPLDPEDETLVAPLVQKIQSILGNRIFPDPPEAISLDR